MIRKKFVYSYVFIYIVTATIISAVTFGIIAYNIKAEQNKTYIAYSERIARNIDDRLITLENFISQISQTKWINKIMYMQGNTLDYDRVPYLSLVEYEGELINFVKSNGFIDDMALIFNKKDFVLSTAGKHSVRDFKDYVFTIKNNDFWESVNTKYNTPQFTPFGEVEFFGLKKTGLLYYCNLPINSVQSADATVLLFTDLSKFYESFNSSYNHNIDYILTDENDNVILSNIPSVMESGLKQLKNHKLFCYTSDKTNWKYYTVVGNNQIYLQFFYGILIAFLIFVAILSIGALFVFRYAANTYKPFNHFLDNLKNNLKISDEIVDDEFYSIGIEVQNILEKQENLVFEIDKQKPIIRNTYLSYILNNDSNLKNFKGLDVILNINFPFTHFCCISTKQTTLNLPDNSDIISYSIDLIEGTTILLNFDNLADDYLENIIALNPGVAIGVGEIANNKDEINISYRDSIKAYSYHNILKQSIIHYSNIKLREDYNFSNIVKNRLYNSLRAANEKDVIAVIEELAKENEAICNKDALTTLYIEVQLIAIKFLNEIDKQSDISPSINYANKKDVVNLCINICRFSQKYIESNKNFQAQEILNYVDIHFKDYDISLNSVGEYFGFSPSYISKFFKENYNVNFLDYLNKKRIELSKELLEKSKLDIIMIAKSVGYDNDVTFRRLFKKYEGLTPSEYRKSSFK